MNNRLCKAGAGTGATCLVIIGSLLIYYYCFIDGIEGQYVSSSCRLREFRCEGLGSNKCLAAKEICDGIAQCPMGDDEEICETVNLQMECKANEMKCRFGGCINNTEICNGHFDCPGGSDEAIETCVGTRPVKPRPVVPEDLKSHKHFQIDYVNMENGTLRELDNPCRLNEFRCDEGLKCLRLTQVCDEQKDCSDEQDEIGNEQWDCSMTTNNTKCGKDEFKCLLGGCISKTKRCNGISDCWGGFDEDSIFCSSTRPYVIKKS